MANLKIYTKGGDDGSTSLWSGKRISKSHPRLHAYGTIDELNSQIGVTLAFLDAQLQSSLLRSQEILFLLGSYLSCDDEKLASHLPSIDPSWTEELEKQIDLMQEKLPVLKNFILPGGHAGAAHLHICRCICRRAEREILGIQDEVLFQNELLKYLNRLSDFMFVAARWTNHSHGIKEQIWKPDLFKK